MSKTDDDTQRAISNVPTQPKNSPLPSILQHAHATLQIPPRHEGSLFPNPTLSVLQLLAFQLPAISPVPSTHHASAYFSRHQQSIDDPKVIQRLPVPPAEIVNKLGQECRRAIESGTLSVICLHIASGSEKRLPMWVIPYWAEVISLRTVHRDPWIRAERNLNQLKQRAKSKRQDHVQVINEVYDALSTLPWSGNVQGFDDPELVSCLATYATRSWLSTVHENQMLDLLRQSVTFVPAAWGAEIENLAFFRNLEAAYGQKDSPDTYQQSNYFSRARSIGHTLASGALDKLATLINLRDEHWIAVVVDFRQEVILYGDSLGHPIDGNVKTIFHWWTRYHTGLDFKFDRLPIMPQSDGFSCGLLSFNAIAHYLLPEENPLIEQRNVDCERLKILLRVVRRHTDETDSFATLGKGYEFTFSATVSQRFQEPTTPIRGNSPDISLVDSVSKLSLGESRVPFRDAASRSSSSRLKDESPSPIARLGRKHFPRTIFSQSPSPTPLPSNKFSESEHLSAYTSSDSDHESDTCSPVEMSPTDRVHRRRYAQSTSSVVQKLNSRRGSRSSSNSESSRSSSPPMQPSTSTKRSFDYRSSTSPPSGPKKKRPRKEVQSSIRIALGNAGEGSSPHGLMKYLKPCTPDEYKAQTRRDTEEVEEFREENRDSSHQIARRKAQIKRDGERSRQKKHRQMRYEAEKDRGERTPGGSKVRKRQVMVHLEDNPGPLKRMKHSIAELSRPKRSIQEKLREKDKKPQGRKRIHEQKDAVYHNWHSPFLWSQIAEAARDPSAAYAMSSSAIRNVLIKTNPAVFSTIARTTIEGWIDRSGNKPRWSDAALRMAEQGNEPGGQGGRVGILANYPDVVKVVTHHLEALRDAGAPLTLVSIRGIMVATIILMADEIFTEQAKDGTVFRCSDSFLRKFLTQTLHWSERRATRAAHKIPKDWEEQCLKAFLRIAYCMKEHDIPSQLFVNTDQTQVVYAQGTKLTWTKSGAKQVSVVGDDEKRAITTVVSVSNNGTLLPFQSIYRGETAKSLPKSTAKSYSAAINHGFRFEYSQTATYWSTQRTMQILVDEIISPYFSAQKKRLGLPESQKSLWLIDVWSVHRSKEFRTWMKKHHPNIIIQYVPGGCTGLVQPCDVGIQRIFKHSIKRSYHKDIVNEILPQLEAGSKAVNIDKRISIVRDRSVDWLYKAFETLNKETIVKKAFEMCRVGDFNLSYESLTSYAAREKLRNLKDSDPEFWHELSQSDKSKKPDVVEGNVQEDEGDVEESGFHDDTNLSCEEMVAYVVDSQLPRGMSKTAEGDLIIVNEAESTDDPGTDINSEVERGPEELGRGRRKKFAKVHANTSSEKFWEAEQ